MNTNPTRNRGLVMGVVGLALLLLNALDYVFGWNRNAPSIGVMGIVFVAIGAGMVRRSRQMAEG